MHPCRRRAGQLSRRAHSLRARHRPHAHHRPRRGHDGLRFLSYAVQGQGLAVAVRAMKIALLDDYQGVALACADWPGIVPQAEVTVFRDTIADRSEEHPSELQSLMRISYAVFCLKKKNTKI